MSCPRTSESMKVTITRNRDSSAMKQKDRLPTQRKDDKVQVKLSKK